MNHCKVYCRQDFLSYPISIVKFFYQNLELFNYPYLYDSDRLIAPIYIHQVLYYLILYFISIIKATELYPFQHQQ
jgi:hypothetical protein